MKGEEIENGAGLILLGPSIFSPISPNTHTHVAYVPNLELVLLIFDLCIKLLDQLYQNEKLRFVFRGSGSVPRSCYLSNSPVGTGDFPLPTDSLDIVGS